MNPAIGIDADYPLGPMLRGLRWHPCCDWDGGGGSILHFSFLTRAWSEIGSFFVGTTPALALARDDFTYQLAVAADGVPCSGCLTPSLTLLDVSTSSLMQIPASWRPIALHALAVP